LLRPKWSLFHTPTDTVSGSVLPPSITIWVPVRLLIKISAFADDAIILQINLNLFIYSELL
jgi:hypothetical protein